MYNTKIEFDFLWLVAKEEGNFERSKSDRFFGKKKKGKHLKWWYCNHDGVGYTVVTTLRVTRWWVAEKYNNLTVIQSMILGPLISEVR